jgi:hypothetical protein
MAVLKEQVICIKFCFNFEKTASESWHKHKPLNCIHVSKVVGIWLGILNVHVAYSYVGLKKMWNSYILFCILQNDSVPQDQTVN